MSTKRGFTLIELMIVVAILGVLAAVATPAYVGYLGSSKKTALNSNVDAAVKLIRNEIAKRAAGEPVYLSTADDFIVVLNSGSKKAIYDRSANAFVPNGSAAAGAVEISENTSSNTYTVVGYDMNASPMPATNVTLSLE